MSAINLCKSNVNKIVFIMNITYPIRYFQIKIYYVNKM